MSSDKGRDRMDRTTAEQFLQGDPAALSAGHPRLAELLAAANASAHPAELAGESAAMAAFTAARHSPVSPARRPSMIQLALAKIMTIKVAAIAGVAFAGVGGVALAANAGVLPDPITQHLPGVHGSSSKSPSAHPTPSGSRAPRPSASAVPQDVAALCRDFDGLRDREHRSKALDQQHFGELVRQAGKKDRDAVEKFCAPRIRPSGSPSGSAKPNRPAGSPSARPDHPGNPSTRPSSPPKGSAAPGGPKTQG